MEWYKLELACKLCFNSHSEGESDVWLLDYSNSELKSKFLSQTFTEKTLPTMQYHIWVIIRGLYVRKYSRLGIERTLKISTRYSGRYLFNYTCLNTFISHLTELNNFCDWIGKVFIYRQHDCVKNVKDDTIKLRQPISESIRIQGHSTKITEFMYTGQKKTIRN